MAIPGQTLTINDPGLGLVEAANTKPLFAGCASAGTVDTKYTFSNKNDVIDTLGQGPLPEAICHCLDVAGGPVDGMRLTGGTAASCGAVAASASGTGTITVAAQVPNDAYEVIVEILTTGSIAGTLFEFRYSLDDGTTYSEAIIAPSGGTYLLPNTAVTMTFVDGAGPTWFVDGDTHSFDCVAPLYTTANLATGVTALLAATLDWAFLALVGEHASGADGATMFGVLETHMSTFANAFHYARAIMSAGDDTTGNIITAMDAVDDNRVSVTYGTADTASGKPFAGWASPAMPLVNNMAARAAASLPSTDLARVASGSLTGVTAISHDEFRTEVLDSHRLTTARAWQGRSGFYITNGRLKSAAGSDFRYWQHGRIMDIASATAYQVQQLFVGIAVRVNSDGTIDELDARRLETRAENALRAALTQPDNAEGTRGHVSELDYAIDRTNNVLTTETILAEVSIRPLGYPKTITTQLGFKANVTEA